MNKRYKWIFCGCCRCWTVICPVCGVASCTGTTGKVHGEDCKECPKSWEFEKINSGKWRGSLKLQDFPKEFTIHEDYTGKEPQYFIDKYEAAMEKILGKVIEEEFGDDS